MIYLLPASTSENLLSPHTLIHCVAVNISINSRFHILDKLWKYLRAVGHHRSKRFFKSTREDHKSRRLYTSQSALNYFINLL